MNSTKITADAIRAMKVLGEKIVALTAYDFPMTKLLDEAAIPLILVGDSLGMVVLGYPDTTHVTMAEMEHHVRAAARAKPRALLGADMPFRSYETAAAAVKNAKKLVAAGAEFVKAEGGRGIIEQVRAIKSAGIPFCGHLGMLPQHVLEEGGYHVKGKSEPEHQALLAAKDISQRISIPTLGIGSGDDCDGQILVTLDLVGMFPWFTPRFVKPRAACAAEIKAAVAAWKQSVTSV
jgi:3-methyl-2-oxobutanoate hydroxymethyltransferase